jgi:hypothetical protein
MSEPDNVRGQVRIVEGRFVLTWQTKTAEGWQHGGTRPLTLPERLAWQIAGRVPKP